MERSSKNFGGDPKSWKADLDGARLKFDMKPHHKHDPFGFK